MFGHPLHPAIVHFPIGLLLSATIADLTHVAGLTSDVHIAAVMIASGLAAALLAMGAGMVDFARLDEKVAPHAIPHMIAVAVAWLGYGLALYLRRDVFSGASAAPLSSVAMSVVSAAVLAFGGWLGGRLVYTFAAGVAKPR